MKPVDSQGTALNRDATPLPTASASSFLSNVLFAGFGLFSYVYFLYAFTGHLLMKINVGSSEWAPELVKDLFPFHIESDQHYNYNSEKIIDQSPPQWQSAKMSVIWLVLFIVQHSLMARPVFKQWIHPRFNRSLFVFVASLVFDLINRSVTENKVGGPPLYQLTNSDNLRNSIVPWIPLIFGGLFTVLATFNIDHFHLFGVIQCLGMDQLKTEFVTSYLLKYIRHPIMLGFIMLNWLSPIMTYDRLIVAILQTAEIVIGVPMEEHDLIQALPEYTEYMKRTPARYFPSLCPVSTIQDTKKEE